MGSRFPILQSLPTDSRTHVENVRLSSASSVATHTTNWTALATAGEIARMSSFDIEACAAPGSAGVAQIQVTLYQPDGSVVQQSRVFSVPTSPLRFKVRVPKGTDWQVTAASIPAYDIVYFGVVSVEVLAHYAVRSSPILA